MTATVRRWRWAGLGAGLVVASVAARSDGLGRGVLLAVPLFALCCLAGVLVGELTVRSPSGDTRAADLEPRRVMSYVPRRLAYVVGATTGGFVLLLLATTAAGSPDDLGRRGRWLTRTCDAISTQSHGPWPGSFYSIPIGLVVAVGLAAAAVTLRQVVRRPRPGGDRVADDLARGATAEAVVAACGLLVALPLTGLALFTGGGLLGIGCRPLWWTPVGWSLVTVSLPLLAFSFWCAALLVPRRDAAPRAGKGRQADQPVNRP